MKYQILILACFLLGTILSSPTINSQKRLIKTSAEEPAKWMDQNEIWDLIENFIHFMDVTDHTFPDISSAADKHIAAIPTELRYQSLVLTMFGFISSPRIQNFVRDSSNYHTRYHTSATGLQSQQWLLEQVTTSVNGYRGEVSVSEVAVPNSPQRNVVVRIEGSDASVKDEVVIIGAHQDSINRLGVTLQATGADDNASGSVVVLETLRIIVSSGFVPKRTLEFQWYAAEEVGLWGSAEIADTYARENVNVVRMLNFDVPGYYAGRDQIAIHNDYTHPQLTNLLRLLTDGYLEFGWVNSTCGYACSDHATFHQAGLPATHAGEVVLHPGMQTATDNFASVGFNQVQQFTKLGIGFMVEMGEPSN